MLDQNRVILVPNGLGVVHKRSFILLIRNSTLNARIHPGWHYYFKTARTKVGSQLTKGTGSYPLGAGTSEV